MVLFLSALLGGAALSWLTGSLDLIAWRRSVDAHWTERARLLFRARMARQLNIILVGLLGLLVSLTWTDGQSWWPALFGGLLGGLIAGLPFERSIDPTLTARGWTHVMIASVVLSFLRFATVGIALASMPSHVGTPMILIAAGFLALQLALEYGMHMRILQWLRLLRPPRPSLQAVVDACSANMGVRVRATWELMLPQANALAFVTTRELAFTPKLLDRLTDEEVRAVCAHELGHISETRWTLLGRVVGSLMFFPLIFLNPAMARFHEPGAIAVFAAAMAIIVFRGRLSRAMEKRADRIAAENSAEKAVYARALEKIYEANRIPAVLSKSSLRPHPNLYDRMLAAGVTPDYPRPKPPPRMRWSSVGLLAIGIAFAVYVFG